MGPWKAQPLWRTASRHISAWQRNRPRFVHRRAFTLPPVASRPLPRSLVVLCEEKRFSDGCWSAWSWMRFLHPYVQLHLFVDGDVSPGHRTVFERLFPGARLSSLPAFLATQSAPSPRFQIFLDAYRYARKLSLILHLQKNESFLYSDSDVLAFRRPDALIERMDNGHNAFMADHCYPGVDPWLRDKARRLALPCHEELNSGLLWIGRDSLDPTLVERLLEDWHPGVYNHFSEQTILGVLMGRRDAMPLPASEYLISAQGMHFWERDITCAELTVRHYTGLVRHRMYSSALPYLARQAKDLMA